MKSGIYNCNNNLAGVLTLQAPRRAIESASTSSRQIPITHVADAPRLMQHKEKKPEQENGKEKAK